MGHQVNFFVLPPDLPAIEAAIRTTGPLCFLEDRTPTHEPSVLQTLAFEAGDMGRRQLRAYITRPSDLRDVKTRFIKQQGYWLIDSLDSPVIEFDRCFFDGQVLRPGRAYFASDLRFRASLPSRDFVKWGDRVMARIRTLLKRAPNIGRNIYASADALRWIEREDVSGDEFAFQKAQARG